MECGHLWPVQSSVGGLHRCFFQVVKELLDFAPIWKPQVEIVPVGNLRLLWGTHGPSLKSGRLKNEIEHKIT